MSEKKQKKESKILGPLEDPGSVLLDTQVGHSAHNHGVKHDHNLY